MQSSIRLFHNAILFLLCPFLQKGTPLQVLEPVFISEDAPLSVFSVFLFPLSTLWGASHLEPVKTIKPLQYSMFNRKLNVLSIV
jgi:hypothetical protein